MTCSFEVNEIKFILKFLQVIRKDEQVFWFDGNHCDGPFNFSQSL